MMMIMILLLLLLLSSSSFLDYIPRRRGERSFFGVFFRVDARWASRRADRPLFLNELFLLIIFVSRMM
jgi:hypothetical protein